MPEAITQIHLVDDLAQAYKVAHDLEAQGIGLDVEGVLSPFYGNEHREPGQTLWFDGGNIRLTQEHMNEFPEVRHGLMTNNTNSRFTESTEGLVDLVQAFLQLDGHSVPYVHKGMVLPDGHEVGKKPSGDQGRMLAEIFNIPAPDMVLIDDQGIKNTGEAVKAGFRAIIVPNPRGAIDSRGRVIEHPAVMRFRKYEPLVYRSLTKKGNLAMGAFKMIAGVDLSQIANFEDHRSTPAR